MMTLFKAALVLFGLTSIVSICSPVQAQDVRRLRTAITSPGMTNLNLYIAEQQGFFEEQRIFGEIIVMRSAARQIQALIAESAEFSAQAPDALIRADERGAELTMLSGFGNSAAYDLVAGKKYQRIEDLRGTTLGVSGINSSSTLLLQRMLTAHGLAYPRDYVLVEVGGTTDRLAAIQSGAVSAGVLNPPISYIAADQGFKILGEVKQYVPEVQFTALSARRPWARANADLVVDYLTAILKANRYLYNNKAGTVAIIKNFFRIQPDYADRVYEYWVRNQVTPREGAVTIPGTDVVIDILEKLGDFKGKARPKAEEFVDDSFLRRAQARVR